MKNFCINTFLAGLIVMVGTAGADELRRLLPDSVAGYKAGGAAEFFDGDNLFSLIDGGAEVYRSLNVRRVVSRRYEGPGAVEILVDIFDMGSPADAFGAYHHDIREGESAGTGQESEYQGGSLYFWKGRYFVSVVSLRRGTGVKKAVLSLGRAVAGAVRSEGTPPDLVAELPATGLLKSHLHYFHDWALFSRYVGLSGENPLGLSEKTEGVVGRYKSPRMIGLVIRYPSAKAAQSASGSFTDEVLAGKGAGRPKRLDEGWAAFRIDGKLLWLVLEAESPAAAEQWLASSVKKERSGHGKR